MPYSWVLGDEDGGKYLRSPQLWASPQVRGSSLLILQICTSTFFSAFPNLRPKVLALQQIKSTKMRVDLERDFPKYPSGIKIQKRPGLTLHIQHAPQRLMPDSKSFERPSKSECVPDGCGRQARLPLLDWWLPSVSPKDYQLSLYLKQHRIHCVEFTCT